MSNFRIHFWKLTLKVKGVNDERRKYSKNVGDLKTKLRKKKEKQQDGSDVKIDEVIKLGSSIKVTLIIIAR